MRLWPLLLALPAFVSGAMAQPRPDTLRMTCAQARGLVASQGAVVLYTGPYAYDRFVRESTFCFRPDRTEPAWIATLDSPQCPVGFRCVSRGIRLRD
jgi:hypothetical protein